MAEELGQGPAIAETNAPEVEQSTEVVAESAPASPEPAVPERDKVQERFDKLTREKYDYAYRAESAEARAARLEAELNEARTAKPQSVAPTSYPKLADYDFDEDKHAQAIEQWHEARTVATERRLREERAEAEREQSFQQRQAKFASTKPDYTERVLRNPALSVTKQMGDAIRDSELGPQVAYYLSENLEQAAAISQMAPAAQVRAIGRIEERLELAAKAPPPPPVVSKAPPPPPKLEAVNASVDKDPKDMSDTEFAKWRQRQIAQRR